MIVGISSKNIQNAVLSHVMCGIFGYIGQEDPVGICLFGLKQLEYRGYDSSGIAGLSQQRELLFCKKVGKISALEHHVSPLSGKLTLAIAHTRWATHGKLTDENAHPHFDEKSQIALVHNGIVENYAALKDELKQKGVRFTSETDTEVIVQLIGQCYRGDLLLAVQEALAMTSGSFALALIHSSHPGQIIAAARENPLCIGFDPSGSETIISSDPNAMLPSTTRVLFLKSSEIAQIERGKASLFDCSPHRLITREPEQLHVSFTALSKQGYDHYMQKEIFEQPATIQRALLGRMNREEGTVEFRELRLREEELLNMRSIFLIGCGTSAHAGHLATLLFEDLAHLPAQFDIASEARYRNLTLTPDTLVIAISQSGETADTLAAMREAKRRGCKILGICNVVNSALAREADSTLFLHAGPEISVCSTKAFTSQLAVLVLVALYLARLRGVLDKRALLSFFSELQDIPGQIQRILDRALDLQILAKKYARYDDFFFIGRSYMVPTCLEAALKLKEISYVNANGVPAGELKHGLIALVHEHFPVVAFSANAKTQEKIASNIMQVKARGAPVLAFLPESDQSIAKTADDVFLLPHSSDPLAPFLSTIAGQLLAYYIAKERGCDIDQPRNLAKSVTVE